MFIKLRVLSVLKIKWKLVSNGAIFSNLIEGYRKNRMKTISLILKSLRCRSAVAPLMSLLLSIRSRSCYRLRCRSVVAPLSNRCRSAITSVAPLPLLSLLLS